VVLIVVAIILLSVLQGGASPSSSSAASRGADRRPSALRAPTRSHMASTMAATQRPLFKALSGVGESMTAKGLLPDSSCRAMSASLVTCTRPHYAVNAVTFRTFRANFGNCTETMTNGEIGWKHDFKHPSQYPIRMFTSGRITDDQAAGRMYCTLSDDLLHLGYAYMSK
jgi:hypothetical protein